MKFCKKCGCETERGRRNSCKPCTRKNARKWLAANREKSHARSRAWYASNKEKALAISRKWNAANKEKALEASRKSRAADRRRDLLTGARGRAKHRHLPFDLTIEDIVIPAHCPALGILLEVNKGYGAAPSSPTLDRIRPELGYVRGNVVVISHKANVIKNNSTPEELMAVAKWVRTVYPQWLLTD